MSRRWLVAVSVVAHLSIVAGLFVSGIWRIDRMEAGRRHLDIGVSPPPPPASSGGPVSRVEFKNHPKHKQVVKEPIQPVVRPPEPTEPARPDPDGIGTGSGSGAPTSNSTCTENCGEDTAPPPPPDPVCGNGVVETGEQCDDGNAAGGDGCSSTCRIVVKPAVIAPGVLQALRISGETQLHPSAVTQNQMVRDGVSRVEALVTLCVTPSGGVGSTTMRTSTGYEAYDRILLAAVRDWRYRPYMVNGAPVPACSVVRFIYTIH